MQEGPAIHWLKHGSKQTTFNVTKHKFGNAKGTMVGTAICQQTKSCPTMKGLLPKVADRVWCQLHPTGKLFSSTYVDSSPSAWS
jgi:hypothetical protein